MSLCVYQMGLSINDEALYLVGFSITTCTDHLGMIGGTIYGQTRITSPESEKVLPAEFAPTPQALPW